MPWSCCSFLLRLSIGNLHATPSDSCICLVSIQKKSMISIGLAAFSKFFSLDPIKIDIILSKLKVSSGGLGVEAPEAPFCTD